jgi:hypothetical protein
VVILVWGLRAVYKRVFSSVATDGAGSLDGWRASRGFGGFVERDQKWGDDDGGPRAGSDSGRGFDW